MSNAVSKGSTVRTLASVGFTVEQAPPPFVPEYGCFKNKTIH